ncbi:hypothetical protein EGW08_008676 [Elysia chlorotica]|uniref:THAP-type domain-containing protein n=1 Tax=Elysia chlorotica TaxID=188477 RepID=A0A3S1HPF8_ELYCH|nr:hypothetical protein EGW08_008676 [Elysia chlorotica]
MESMLYGLTVIDVRRLAYDLAEKQGIGHRFNKTTELAGVDWMEGFLKRNPTVSIRRPEAVKAKQLREKARQGKAKPTKDVLSDSDEDEYPCLVCGEDFSRSKPGEKWVTCVACEKWSHEECTHGLGLYICQNCDTDDSASELPSFTVSHATGDVLNADLPSHLNYNCLQARIEARRLLQQFMVDAYAKIESERLQFLRADNYKDLRDTIVNQDGDPRNVGQKAIETTLDSHAPRTTRTIPQRQHAPWFSESIPEAKKCSKWVINLRRADLHLKNIKHKTMCSVHFEENTYNCPSDIATSRLLPSAVPTIIACPNPRLSASCRPPPKKRCVDTCESIGLEAGESLCADSDPSEDELTCTDGTKIESSEEKLQKLEKELPKAKLALKHYQSRNKLLCKQVKRLKTANEKCVAKEFEKAIKFDLENFLKQLPPLPSVLS